MVFQNSVKKNSVTRLIGARNTSPASKSIFFLFFSDKFLSRFRPVSLSLSVPACSSRPLSAPPILWSRLFRFFDSSKVPVPRSLGFLFFYFYRVLPGFPFWPYTSVGSTRPCSCLVVPSFTEFSFLANGGLSVFLFRFGLFRFGSTKLYLVFFYRVFLWSYLGWVHSALQLPRCT